MAAVCIFCASSERIDPSYLELAAEVGREVARRGHRLVSGGGSIGCMGAVARACRDAGGHTTGVIPQALVDLEVADHDADELVVTGGMRERKGEMERRSDAFLTLPGGLGTLEELFEIWCARTLALHDKPLVVLDPDGALADVRRLVDGLVERGFVRAPARDTVRWTTTAAEALDALEEELRAPRPTAVAAPLAARAEELLEAEP